jgi:hypothetical protein
MRATRISAILALALLCGTALAQAQDAADELL